MLSFRVCAPRNPLQWLARNGVRCFSHNTDGSGLPVRYISKRNREVNQTKRTASVDVSPKDGIDSMKNFKGLRVGSNADGKLLNALLDSKHGPVVLNDRDWRGNEVPDKWHTEVRERVVDWMKPTGVVAHNPLSNKIGGLSQDFNLNQEFSCDEIVDEEYMEAHEEFVEEVVEEAHSNNYDVKGKRDMTRQGAEKSAARLLTRRAYTLAELRKKLSAKHFPHNIVEAVLRDFKSRGLINDEMYAESFSHSRWKSLSWGPRRIKYALKEKGVSAVDVDKAVKLVFEDSEGGDQRSSVKLSSSSLHQLYIQASKQWQRSQNAPHETRKARVVRWLQYRGFDWGVVATIMKKLESENPRSNRP